MLRAAVAGFTKVQPTAIVHISNQRMQLAIPRAMSSSSIPSASIRDAREITSHVARRPAECLASVADECDNTLVDGVEAGAGREDSVLVGHVGLQSCKRMEG